MSVSGPAAPGRQIEAVPRELPLPCLFNCAPSGRSPLLPLGRLAALGYAVILLPVQTLFAGARAMADYLERLRATGDPGTLDDRLMACAEFNRLIGVPEMLLREERLRPDEEVS